MNMAKHCMQLGMNLEEFKAYEQAVKTEAKAVYDNATKIRPQDTGMYFETEEILKVTEQRDYFIIDELKKLGVEFIENLTLYRI